MSELTGLLQTLEPGHWLIIAGGIFVLIGTFGLLIGRSRRTGSEVDDPAEAD
ncbi:hypothetical protein ACVW16_004168 [Bradyrhizobium sp. USDA 4474]